MSGISVKRVQAGLSRMALSGQLDFFDVGSKFETLKKTGELGFVKWFPRRWCGEAYENPPSSGGRKTHRQHKDTPRAYLPTTQPESSQS